MKLIHAILAAGVLLGAGVTLQAGQDTKAQEAKAVKTDAMIIAEQAPSYPLDTCIISGDKMEAPVDNVVDGKLVRTCCKMCGKKVQADPATYIAKVDAAVIKEQKASYPMKTCAISGEDLGSMGDVIDRVHGTRLVRLCCKGCVKGFEKNPSKTLAKVDAALIEAQKKTYPVDTCLVSQEKLGSMGETIDMLYGTQLVRLCCKGCVRSYKKDPAKYVAMLKEAGDKKDGSKKKKKIKQG